MCTEKNLLFVHSPGPVSGSGQATKHYFSNQQQEAHVHRTREGSKSMKTDVEVTLFLPDRRVTLLLLCFTVTFVIFGEVTLNYLPRDIVYFLVCRDILLF